MTLLVLSEQWRQLVTIIVNILIIVNIALFGKILCLCDIDSIVRAVEAIGLNISEYFHYSERCVFTCSILCLFDIDSIVRAVEPIGLNISQYFVYSGRCVFSCSILCLCDIDM